MYRVAELFAGTGAFSLAFRRVDNSKYKIVYANDIEPRKIFDENNLETLLDCRDLTTVNVDEIPEMDILTCGFPCQPFSIAGKQNGFDDPRSNVFWKIIEVLRKHKPRLAVLENVKNLTSHDKGHTFNVIKENLENESYQLKYKVLNTSIVTNIPQNRERIYIMCFRDQIDYDTFQFSEITANEKLNIETLLDNNVNPKYYYTTNSTIWDKLAESVLDNIHSNAVYQYRRYYVRKNKSNLCPTLTANMGCGGHNVPIIKDDNGIRKLTPRECFKLQGFPSNYIIPHNLSDAKLYKLAGNAVSVPVVEYIIRSLPF
jgi:DNA (cytosine-5)-methyltransferase 1